MKIIAITHQGLNTKYDHNEDSLVIDEQTISIKDFDYDKSFLFKRRGVFAVCDGVGGNFGGEIASHAIAQAIVNFTKEHEIKSEMDIYTLASTMKEGVENAHNEYGSKEMMSTFVGLFINKKHR